VNLIATGAVSPVAVNTGRALVYGTWYESDASVNVVVATPAGATRIDRIVLRKSWASQTVRITRIAGAEGGGAPAVTQTAGTTWDLPLYRASITVGGVITLTDDRDFIPKIIAKGADIVSAATITLGDDGNFFDITGSVNITNITAKPAGFIAYLQFDSSLVVVDGGNLILSGDFVTATQSLLTIICDGTNWFELSRSPVIKFKPNILPSAMGVPISNPARFSTYDLTALGITFPIDVLLFDQTTSESAIISFVLPSNLSVSACNAIIKWFAASDVTAPNDTVRWDITHTPVSVGDELEAAGTTDSISSTSAVGAGSGEKLNSASIALTMTGYSPGDIVLLRLSRNPGHADDDLTQDASFIGLELEFS